MRDEKNDGNRSDGYQYRTYNSSCENGKEILEVDQFGYIFVWWITFMRLSVLIVGCESIFARSLVDERRSISGMWA